MKDLQNPLKDQSRWLKPKDSTSSSSKKPHKVAKKSLNGAFASVVEDSFSSDSSQTSATISDLTATNSTVTGDAGRPAEDVYAMENLVRQVRSRQVLEELIKAAVAEHLAATSLVSPPVEGIDRLLNCKLGITLISFLAWCLAVSVAVPFALGHHAGLSPT